MTSNTNELSELLKSIANDVASDYERILREAQTDPGTAGNISEEGWAALLRTWLPPSLQIVTKGRIIGHKNGDSSPQIDILILQDVYPQKLLEKKLYLAGGVLAAFECKSTLRSNHIAEAVKTSVKIKQLSQDRTGSPYAELHSPIIYGLLAQSHSWKQEDSQPEQNVTERLLKEDLLHVTHPKYCMDLLCVADLGIWTSWKYTFHPPVTNEALKETGRDNVVASEYKVSTRQLNTHSSRFTPIGGLIGDLSRRLAWEIPSLRPLADYYFMTLRGSGKIHERFWSTEVYSDPVRRRVEQGRLRPKIIGVWNEWDKQFV